jgi:hypothetical protein
MRLLGTILVWDEVFWNEFVGLEEIFEFGYDRLF